MSRKLLLPGVAALGLLGGAASAQPPAAPTPQGQIIRWPGGWIELDGNGTVLRQSSPGGSTTTITGSANGVGNRIVVDNGGSPGVTVIRNSRNGVGNSVTVTPAGPVVDVPPRAIEYPGRGAKFWTKTGYSRVLGWTLYWSPKDRTWFWYDKAGDVYHAFPPDFDPDVR